MVPENRFATAGHVVHLVVELHRRRDALRFDAEDPPDEEAPVRVAGDDAENERAEGDDDGAHGLWPGVFGGQRTANAPDGEVVSEALVNRTSSSSRGATVALETTLLCHGVRKETALPLADQLDAIVRESGGVPALVGVVAGVPTVGMTREELSLLLNADAVEKVNTANIGLAIHARRHAATTVSATMELASLAGVRFFATGGIGGVHRNYAQHFDVSSDLAAFTRFPVAVVTSGVKSLLDVVATREALESLGVPVVGYKTDRFPAFYLRDGGVGVDARFDDVDELATFVRAELKRAGRGIVVANPIPIADQIASLEWESWLAEATARAGDPRGRDVTPRVLALLHEISGGRTLRANLALVKNNAALAGALAARVGTTPIRSL
ncbi:MAG: pseudouridine-5'-phosphate glycosidase [Leptolyngbya sp. PLA3]|nr:MAG: pseudouridine-5'-phosphate glycosidase [Cyanobacteria bacterium CYA]MCE7969883.1 pseudouridine-5'-phosphate glycosidase [Leptolyngbya sp. PL-A3]